MVRIGGGEFKGRILKTPKTKLTRVSTSYFRKVIFDTLAPYIQGATVLDLYAGSGSLGFEAISRGAAKGYFIDKERKPIDAIKANIDLLEIKEKCSVFKKDAGLYLQSHVGEIDMVFLDPPYSIPLKDLISLLTFFDTIPWFSEDGIICLELQTPYAKTVKDITFNKFSIFKEKVKGETTLLFFS